MVVVVTNACNRLFVQRKCEAQDAAGMEALELTQERTGARIPDANLYKERSLFPTAYGN